MTRAQPLVLVIDDDADIRRSLARELEIAGYQTLAAADGTEGRELFEQHHPDLVVTDLTMPRVDGFSVISAVRRNDRTPVVVLSVRGEDEDKVRALDLGADDYVTKPFGPEELLARVRVALRRTEAEDAVETGVLRAGAITVDFDRRRVIRDDVEIRLTPKEFDLLSLLARNRDRVLTHRVILKEVWGPNAVEQPEHLWTLVAQLRKKIEPDPSQPKYLVSEPWVGYRFVTDGS